MSLATNLITLRKQHGLTQMELAEKLNVSRQAISRWEVGVAAPSTENLKMLSDLYGVSVDDILKGESASVSQCPDLTDSSSEALDSHGNHKKSRIIFACALILIALFVAMVVGVLHSRKSGEKANMPMDNMPMDNMITEEDDGVGDTFSFE